MVTIEGIVRLALLSGAVYAVIPSIWYRVFSNYTIKKMSSGRVALTFDDGPDERYTEEILDELQHLGLKATFFVLSEKALLNKEIIQRMNEEGHQVELHGVRHKCHWLYGHKETYKDIEQSVRAIREIGIEPKYYRPPWGLYNLFTVPACKRHNLTCVHWTVHGYDWSKKATIRSIARRIKKQMYKGDTILLHDSGSIEDAPRRTCKVLTEIAQEIRKKGLSITTINEEDESGGAKEGSTDSV